MKKSRNAPATQVSYSKPLFVRVVRQHQVQRFLCSFHRDRFSFTFAPGRFTFINYDIQYLWLLPSLHHFYADDNCISGGKKHRCLLRCFFNFHGYRRRVWSLYKLRFRNSEILFNRKFRCSIFEILVDRCFVCKFRVLLPYLETIETDIGSSYRELRIRYFNELASR